MIIRPPENSPMPALQYISAARESHSVHNIQAMTLLVLYNLRSPSNSGIWYMIGSAVRTCIDLGLHRETHYAKTTPYEGQLCRRLFWSVYFLVRVIAVSLGRPYSLADQTSMSHFLSKLMALFVTMISFHELL